MQGSRDNNKLWTIDTDNPYMEQQHSMNIAIDTPTLAERIKFFKASLFSLTLDTLAKVIDTGFLTSFPGFTRTQLRKYLPNPIATEKGHMRALRSNIRSTKRTYRTPYHLYNVATT